MTPATVDMHKHRITIEALVALMCESPDPGTRLRAANAILTLAARKP